MTNECNVRDFFLTMLTLDGQLRLILSIDVELTLYVYHDKYLERR